MQGKLVSDQCLRSALRATAHTGSPTHFIELGRELRILGRSVRTDVTDWKRGVGGDFKLVGRGLRPVISAHPGGANFELYQVCQ